MPAPLSPLPLAWLIADLHLSPDDEGLLRLLAVLLARARRAQAPLLILGDLVEYWPGDDALAEDFGGRLASLLAGSGLPLLGLLPGNRDFLFGEDFARRAGVRLLPDPTCLDIGGSPTLLAHGDAYCTADHDYQAFRQLTRGPDWQRQFLALPLAERHRLAQRLRADSRQAQQAKDATIMDVDDGAVAADLARHGCQRLVHGHTHRPGHHRDGGGERWVLPAWQDAPGMLVCDGRGCRAEDL